MSYFRFQVLTLFLALLAACGGNGSAEAPLAASASHPVAKAAVLTGGSGVAIHMYQALYGQAPSYAMLNTYSALAATDASAFARSLTNGFASTSNNALARLVLDNLGVTAVSVTALNSKGQSEYALLLDALTQMFASYGADARGQIILNATNLLAGLESDATYGAAAAAYNNQAASNLSYSANPASTGVRPVMASAFNGNVILGAPTTSSISLKLLSSDQSGVVSIEYGTQPGNYSGRTTAASLLAGEPLLMTLEGLTANTAYYYRVNFQPVSAALGVGTEYSFHTARPVGNTFTFTLQADSHLDENSSLDQYHNTLANVLADKADFHIDLGDTFMTEKHTQALIATVLMAPDQTTVNNRYIYERTHFGLFAHSVPLYLVNGNHDGELGWLTNGTAQVLPVWASQARQSYFVNPKPGPFYGGDPYLEPFIGERSSWYSWQWGDALFVVLDPYWGSKTQASKDGWNLTLGERQYQWLVSTLAASTTKYKFIFIHNLVGGLDGQMRGGVEAAPYFEWGGKNADGTDGFALQRPGWAMPVHQLLVKNKVTAVFHGHDHLYVKQDLDGIVYQEVPQPSAINNANGPNQATAYHYSSGTILSSSGHLRVSVTPTAVSSEYVRSWLPANENALRKNRQVDDRWTITPH